MKKIPYDAESKELKSIASMVMNYMDFDPNDLLSIVGKSSELRHCKKEDFDRINATHLWE